MRLFLDTNVLIDYLGRRVPFFDDVKKLFIAQAFGDVELWASAKSFTDVFYVLRDAVGSARLQEMFEKSSSKLRICAVGGEDILAATSLRWEDFEDALVYICAQSTGADFLVTRDERGFGKSRIEALSPNGMIALLRDRNGTIYDEVKI